MNEWIKAGGIAVVIIGIVSGVYLQIKHTDTPSVGSSQGDTTSWATYSEDGFTIKLPTPPVISRITGTSATNAGYSEYDVYSSHNGENIIIIETMKYLPSSDTTNVESILDSAYEKIRTVRDVKIFSSERKVQKGGISQEVYFMDPNNTQWTKALLFITSDLKKSTPVRYFTVSELSSDGRYNDSDFKILIDSFEPTI